MKTSHSGVFRSATSLALSPFRPPACFSWIAAQISASRVLGEVPQEVPATQLGDVRFALQVVELLQWSSTSCLSRFELCGIDRAESMIGNQEFDAPWSIARTRIGWFCSSLHPASSKSRRWGRRARQAGRSLSWILKASDIGRDVSQVSHWT